MWVTISLNVSPEMGEQIEDEAERLDVSNTRYIRALLRQAQSSPFKLQEDDLNVLRVNDSDAEEAQKGAA
jgi:3-deoxy-D-arabino-heptulosonate 7-phosphate (DAHP) synthase